MAIESIHIEKQIIDLSSYLIKQANQYREIFFKVYGVYPFPKIYGFEGHRVSFGETYMYYLFDDESINSMQAICRIKEICQSKEDIEMFLTEKKGI